MGFELNSCVLCTLMLSSVVKAGKRWGVRHGCTTCGVVLGACGVASAGALQGCADCRKPMVCRTPSLTELFVVVDSCGCSRPLRDSVAARHSRTCTCTCCVPCRYTSEEEEAEYLWRLRDWAAAATGGV